MRSVWRTVDRKRTRAIVLLCLADTLVAVSFGAVAVGGGLAPWIPIVLSLLVFAGGAQFAAVGTVLSGGSATAAVVTGLLLNARLLPFGFSVSGVIRGRGPLRQVLGAQLVTDETVAMAIAERDPERRAAVFWFCGLCLFVCWNLGVALGAGVGAQVGDTDALGLDAAFPAVLVAIVLPALNTGRIRWAAGIGGVAAVVSTPLLAPGLPVLASLGGLVALAGRRTPGGGRLPEGAPSPESPPPTAGPHPPGSLSPAAGSHPPGSLSPADGSRSPEGSPPAEGLRSPESRPPADGWRTPASRPPSEGRP